MWHYELNIGQKLQDSFSNDWISKLKQIRKLVSFETSKLSLRKKNNVSICICLFEWRQNHFHGQASQRRIQQHDLIAQWLNPVQELHDVQT